MSVLGKIVGGAAGFALGGPLGGLVGTLAGHAVDVYRRGQHADAEPEDATRKVGFTIGVIVLGAKMAKVDGTVTRDEVTAFKRVFRTPPDEERNVRRVFDLARRDARGFEPYARQLSRMLRDSPEVLEELLGCLFEIAKADGSVDSAEINFLRKVATIFGFDEAAFARIRATHLGPDPDDPYTVLGIGHDASVGEIKAAYRRLIHDHHPDRLTAAGMPEEFLDVANQKMAAINGAYAAIRKARGFT